MQFVINNILPISMAIVSGGMLFWSIFGERIRGIKTVDCIAALQLINHKNALILDVREDKEYQAGHLLNSKWIPVNKLKERISDLEKHKDKPIVVVCHSGARAGTACTVLNKQGFTQAYTLIGGITAWEKANLPLEK